MGKTELKFKPSTKSLYPSRGLSAILKTVGDLISFKKPLSLPILLGTAVILQVLPSYFQLDDFSILCAIRYVYTSFWDSFRVWPLGFWRPLQIATLHWEAGWFGSSPIGYRVVHGAIYLASIVLYFHLIRRITNSPATAGIAVLLFASTYSHWEAVQWICASSELWVGLFALVFWIALLHQPDSKRRFWVWIAFTSHLAALFTKENAVALLPISGVIWFYQKNSTGWKPRGLWIGLGVSWITALLWRTSIAMNGEVVQKGIYTFSSHSLHNLGAWILRMLFPWIYSPTYFTALITLGAAIGVTYWLWHRNHSLALLGILWMWLALLPYSGFNLAQVFPSRYTYLAGMGLYLSVAVGLELILKRSVFYMQTVGTGLLVFCIFNASLYTTHEEIKKWQSRDGYFRTMAESLKDLQLPPVQSIAVMNLNTPPEYGEPAFIFRAIYALAYPPPEKIWAGPGPWLEKPELILEFKAGKFVRKTDLNPSP